MIHIVQCLCPSRHCILAAAYDPADQPGISGEDLLRQQVKTLLESKAIGPKCGICGSSNWSYEDRESRFKTMEEASPALHQSEEEQRWTREYFERNKN